MSRRTLPLTDELHAYLVAHSVREHPLLRRLREETATMPEAGMQIAPEQGQFMALLVRLMDARRALEVGVFTGYSSLSVALALPEDGIVTACDVSEEYTRVARRFWDDAGVGHKVELRLGPAVETLDRLLAEGRREWYDFAFIDADKTAYDDYFERALTLIRPGGLILLDNVLRDGAVVDVSDTDPGTIAIRSINDKIYRDERVDVSMLPLADGLTLARKRAVT